MPEIFGDLRFRHVGNLPFSAPSPDSRRPGLESRLISHAIKPVANHVPWHNGSRFTDQHQKRGLESILGVVMAAEQTMAHAPDHRPMPAYQSPERRVFVVAEVAL